MYNQYIGMYFGNTMELFDHDAFSIGVVLKDINEQVNSLVVEAATLQSCNDML